jgi:hypothetical protein
VEEQVYVVLVTGKSKLLALFVRVIKNAFHVMEPADILANIVRVMVYAQIVTTGGVLVRVVMEKVL